MLQSIDKDLPLNAAHTMFHEAHELTKRLSEEHNDSLPCMLPEAFAIIAREHGLSVRYLT